MQCSSSKSPTEKQFQSISRKFISCRKQICNFFTIDYDTFTTKKDVKYSLKRLVKRGVISKDGEGYSYIQPHQISVDSSTSSDKGYHKVDEPSDYDVSTGSSIEHSAAMSRGDIEQPLSLDDEILFYIRDCQSSSSTSGAQAFISKEQIQKYYDSIVDEYDTTKKNVKHSLKRLIERNDIKKVGKKNYSYIQTQQSGDICTIITDRPNKRKRQLEVAESSEHESAATLKPTTVRKYKYTCTHEGCSNHVQIKGVCVKHGAKVKRCKHEGCTNQVVNGGRCVKHGAKKYRYTCKHEGCSTWAETGGFCRKHGGKKKICLHEGCNNQAKSKGVCFKHGAIRKPRKKCEREGCSNNARRLGVCRKHGSLI